MSIHYTDNPPNISEILPWVVTEKDRIISEIFKAARCYFYDTCSFRRHANQDVEYAEYILRYIKGQNGIIMITRCILMELASHSGILNSEYIAYIKRIHDAGITILVIYEEDLFSVMEVCFSTNAAINDHLCWAVRNILGPFSTITETLDHNAELKNEVVKGKKTDSSRVYKHFFEAVRSNKESGDNLGEEMIAICLHILSHIPGEDDGKFCIITEDKGAAGKIDAMFKQTAKQYKGSDIGIFSTQKLVQVLYREKILQDKEQLEAILGSGTDGNIVVLGMKAYDIRDRELTYSVEELAASIIQPNGIRIFF